MSLSTSSSTSSSTSVPVAKSASSRTTAAATVPMAQWFDDVSVSSSAVASKPADDAGIDTPLLPFPMSYFDVKTGQPPKSEDDATRLWQWRRNRPPPGHDTEPIPDNAGMIILKEARDLHKSLRTYTHQKFMEDARTMAKVWSLTIPGTNEYPILPKDFQKAYSALNRDNSGKGYNDERKVYMTAHHFHRNRNWLTDVVDKWCENVAKIRIIGCGGHGAGKRKHIGDRGGFTVAARQAKSQAVKMLMRPMLQKAGWSIATTNQEGRGNQTRKYEPITIHIAMTGDHQDCYVVTKQHQPALSKTKISAVAGTEGTLQNPIEIDSVLNISNFASELGNAIGRQVSEDTIRCICEKAFKKCPAVSVKEIECRNKSSNDLSTLSMNLESEKVCIGCCVVQC